MDCRLSPLCWYHSERSIQLPNRYNCLSRAWPSVRIMALTPSNACPKSRRKPYDLLRLLVHGTRDQVQCELYS